MNRVFSKRARVFTEFGQRLIQDAAAIFGLEQRMEYIAQELARILRLRRVFLASTNTPDLQIAMVESASSKRKVPRLSALALAKETAEHHTATVTWQGKTPLAEIAEQIRTKRIDTVIGPWSGREMLAGADFNYLVPLRYEDRLVGLLFLDTSPRLLLGVDESILTGLSAQISQSIESCLLIERKIDLETSLERSKHMAEMASPESRTKSGTHSPRSKRWHK